MEYGAREQSVQVYLGESVLLGTMFAAVDELVEFFNVGGRYLHLHQPMWFPYREGASAANRREAVVSKSEVLFVVHRRGLPAVAGAEEEQEDWQPLEVSTGRFVLRGCADLAAAGTVGNLIASPERFFVLRDVGIEGPIGAVFTEPLVIVNGDRVSFVATR
ncbi:MAG TPA: hypothetical protein VMU89_18800 [Thermomicrobiaceae bacterium]|nr:hypothetical protein [Thermomicrobiaceae bacterium]